MKMERKVLHIFGRIMEPENTEIKVNFCAMEKENKTVCSSERNMET
jgi:hypothetical protein